MKPILIVDAYIEDDNQEKLLNNFLGRVLNIYPIFLISNSKINQNTLDKVDYFFYDKKNNLFEDEYDNYESFYLWGIVDKFKLHNLYVHKQRHGLSVLINLFRSLKIVKELDFTHFIRVEYDAILGKKTLEDYKNIFNELNVYGKKLKCFVNQNNKVQSFQYFAGEIDFFLNNFIKIKSEKEYQQFINQKYGNNNFVTVEKIMFDLINDLNCENIIILNDLSFELDDTIWNQSASKSHIPKNMVKCQSELYSLKDTDKIILFSKSNTNDKIFRKIILKTDTDDIVFNYFFNEEGIWYFEYIDKKINNIIIYDNDEIILNEKINKIHNYIEILD